MVVSLMVLASCSADVDIYADYKEIPVVYAIIDAQADTNFVKITKSFCGTNDNPVNANQAAQLYDSSNYSEKLDAYIVELKSIPGQSFEPTGRRIVLDTMTIHDKMEGVFYAPHQKLYYTTERFNTNSVNEKYRYQLCVITPDHDTVFSETSVVGGNVTVGTSMVSFQSHPSNAFSKLIFSSTEEGILYDIGMQFNYLEGRPGQTLTHKEVTWHHNAKLLSAYEKVPHTENLYWFYYSVNTLFNCLERAIGADTIADENHPNIVRYIGDFYVFVSAAGEDYYNYQQFLQMSQSGLTMSSEYSNIEGGCGLFSSRIFVKQQADLSSNTKLDLFRKPWGFQER